MAENPIDKDKVTETPASLLYAHNVGGALIKPTDSKKIKSNAMSAMVQQTNAQMQQIYEQAQVLAEQANKIRRRVEISEKIYTAQIAFQPKIGETYYLYEKADGKETVSKVGPRQWGSLMPFKAFVASVRLLADHTWEVVEEG